MPAASREDDLGERVINGVTVRVTRLTWTTGGLSYDVHRTCDDVDLTADGSFDTNPTDEQIAELLRDAPPVSAVIATCPGGNVFRAGDEGILIDHIKECPHVDGIGQPTSPTATVHTRFPRHPGVTKPRASVAATAPTPNPDAVTMFADKIMQMLREDAADATIPYAVTDFRDLHSFVDANMYLEHAGHRYEPGNPASLAEINAITNDITRRLQAGELTGGGWSELRWNATVQHVATVPNVVARRLLRLDPQDSIAASWLHADVDDDVLAEIEGPHSHADVYGREVLEVQPSAERLLTADEVDEIGLDAGGRDGHPEYPHRWTTLTDSQRATLRRLGGTAINAAEVCTDTHVAEHPTPPPGGTGRLLPDRSASPTTSTTVGQENPPMGSAKDIWIDMLDATENKGRRDATHHGSLPSDERLWAYARTLPGGDSLSEGPDAAMVAQLREAYNVGRQPTRIDLDVVVQAVTAAGHHAFVEVTGGNTATLYAGRAVADEGERLRWSAVAAPCWFEGLGWTRPFADTAEFSVGPDDQGASDGPMVPAHTYPAQVAALIVEVIENVERQRAQSDAAYASDQAIRCVHGDDIADAVARTYERDAPARE